MEESTNAYRILVGRPDEERSLGRSRRTSWDNRPIKMDLKKVGCAAGNWMDQDQNKDQ